MTKRTNTELINILNNHKHTNLDLFLGGPKKVI